MNKSNNKNYRTDGVINSKNIEFPTSMNSTNTPLTNYNYTNKQKIKEQTMENKKF